MRINRAAGFTLLEVMVAVGVFALLSVGYLIASQQAVQNIARIEAKTVAYWLAQDFAVRVDADEVAAPDGFDDTVEFAERDFWIKVSRVPTQAQSLERVIITVGQSQEQLARLETYLDKGL